jgi:cell division protein FtsB
MTISGSRSWIYACLAGLFLAMATYVVFDREAGWLQVHALEQQHNRLTAEARALEARRDFLSQRIELLEVRDPQTLEAVAREKNMIYPGDTVYRIHYRSPAELESVR